MVTSDTCWSLPEATSSTEFVLQTVSVVSWKQQSKYQKVNTLMHGLIYEGFMNFKTNNNKDITNINNHTRHMKLKLQPKLLQS